MLRIDANSRWLLLAPITFLLILPFPHTVTPRLLALFITLITAVMLWKAYAPPPVPCKMSISLWAALALLSLLVAVDPAYSAGEVKNEVGYTLAAFVGFYALTRNERALALFLGAIGVAFVVLTGAALASWWKLGYWSEEQHFAGAASYSTFVATTAPLLVLLWSAHRLRKQSALIVLSGLSVLAITGAYLTLQRATLPIVLAQLTVALFLLRGRGLLRVPRVAILATVLVGLLLTIAASQTISRVRFHENFVDFGIQDIRLGKLEPVVTRILETPLVGDGFGRRTMIKAHPDLAKDDPIFWHAHNILLNYGIQLGLPGIAALMALFACLGWNFFHLYRSRDATVCAVGIAGMLMIFGVLARNQTNDLFVRDLSLLFWAICGMLLGFGRRRVAAQAQT